MKTSIASVISCFVILYSCNTDERPAVFAGIYDSDFIYQEFEAPVVVQLKEDTIQGFFFGADSIDLNKDGLYDLIISQRLLIPLPSEISSFEQFPYYRLIPKNGFEIAKRIQSYPVGQGQTSNQDWVDAIDFKIRIDDFKDWSETNRNVSMWMIPPSLFFGTYGTWFEITNPEKYIGFRMKVGSAYKYGWIKVDARIKESIRFLSVAIEK